VHPQVAFDGVQDFRIVVDREKDRLAHTVDDTGPVNPFGSR
jgi:hypothetical protein